MEKDAAKRRNWIKNIAIIFLIILLLLTFFSNTILTYSLPEVSAQYTQYSNLSSTVKLTGSVAANERYNVVYEQTDPDMVVQTRKVTAVYVKEGDTVEKDQVIMTVNGGMSEELEAARKEYDELKKSYDLALIGDNTSYLQSSKTLTDAQNEYDEAVKTLDGLKKQYDKLLSGKKSEEIKERIKTLNTQIAELDKKIAETELKLEECKAQIGSGRNQTSLITAEKDLTALTANYNTLKNREASLKKELDDMSDEVEDMSTANSLTNEMSSLRESNAMLMMDYVNNIAEIMANNEKISECEQKLAIMGQPEVTDVELFAAQRKLAELQDEYAEVSEEYQKIVPEYEAQKELVETLRTQNTALGEAEEYSALLKVYNDQKEEFSKELEGLSDPDELKDQITAAEKNVSNLQAELDILKSSTYQNNKANQIDRNSQKEQLDKLAEKIKKYETAPETLTVTAPVKGRIAGIYPIPGGTVSSGDTVADIEIADKGYKCEINVSSEEARKIAVGAPVTVSNSWWYSNIEASIIQIKSDVTSQGKNKIVIISVSGDVYEGQSLTFTVGDKSTSYDTVLPNSAIREDVDGSFVLTVESKKTVLGVRYKAHRVPVDVIASDDTKSAVSGLFGSEFVITNSTSPISDGQQVRLADN